MKAHAQIGGSHAARELAELAYRGNEVAPISSREFARRRTRACTMMRRLGFSTLVLGPGANLRYFTGVERRGSERLTAAMLLEDGTVVWIAPHFEKPKLRRDIGSDARIEIWHEDEDPFALVHALAGTAMVALDESLPFWAVQRAFDALGYERCRPATPVTSGMRMTKSAAELAIIRHVMNLTLEVHRRTARILRPGIAASEVRAFIDQAHMKLAGSRSTFCIVSFGEETAYPHGGGGEAYLNEGDLVLIDTGTTLHGYHSDITRTYAFGTVDERQREVWEIERGAQAAAFAAARLGDACEEVDHAARRFLAAHGFGPDYEVPGLPHRTGHGLGLEIHEHPYLVRGNTTPLAAGMCFSNEPMICIYGAFGVRLEDHFYMSETGPVWFTQPAHSIDRPFPDEQGSLPS